MSTLLCYAAGAEIAVEPNPVHGLSESGTSHEMNPPTTAPATTAPATDEYDDVIFNPIAD